jgi:NaMN:DMB phosphoribosyltransferase
LLAGGTQMLAVYALACALAQTIPPIAWQPKQVVVGTTRWVVEDVTGDTVGLAEAIATQFQQPVTLLGTQLNFQSSTWLQLQAYEAGFVKEGVGAGGLAIAASLMAGRENADLLQAIEDLLQRYRRLRHPTG